MRDPEGGGAGVTEADGVREIGAMSPHPGRTASASVVGEGGGTTPHPGWGEERRLPAGKGLAG